MKLTEEQRGVGDEMRSLLPQQPVLAADDDEDGDDDDGCVVSGSEMATMLDYSLVASWTATELRRLGRRLIGAVGSLCRRQAAWCGAHAVTMDKYQLAGRLMWCGDRKEDLTWRHAEAW